MKPQVNGIVRIIRTPACSCVGSDSAAHISKESNSTHSKIIRMKRLEKHCTNDLHLLFTTFSASTIFTFINSEIQQRETIATHHLFLLQDALLLLESEKEKDPHSENYHRYLK